MVQITRFKAYSLFYDLSGNADELFGQTFIEMLNEAKGIQPPPLPAATVSKKGVSFAEPQTNDQQVELLMTEFVKFYSRISTEANIKSALNKL